MQKKLDPHVFTGLQVDTDVTKTKTEFLVDAKNIRFTTRGDNTLLALTNELGTDKVEDTNHNYIQYQGKYMGHCVVGDYLVVFTHDVLDRIYRNKTRLQNNDTDHLLHLSELIYEGNLNFTLGNPLETYGLYENEKIQKVYWIDGINQGRVINVVKSELDGISVEQQRKKYASIDNPFDFIQDLKLTEDVTINLVTGVTGVFPAGVVQYAFNYYNKYGQESNIAYVSPLYYTTFPTRGGSPEETIAVGFDINISNVDTRYEYLRLYSIFRTSIDSVPQVKIVKDFRTTNTTSSTTVNISSNITDVTKEEYTEPTYTPDTPTPDNPNTPTPTPTPSTGGYKEVTGYYPSIHAKSKYVYNIDQWLSVYKMRLMPDMKPPITINKSVGPAVLMDVWNSSRRVELNVTIKDNVVSFEPKDTNSYNEFKGRLDEVENPNGYDTNVCIRIPEGYLVSESGKAYNGQYSDYEELMKGEGPYNVTSWILGNSANSDSGDIEDAEYSVAHAWSYDEAEKYSYPMITDDFKFQIWSKSEDLYALPIEDPLYAEGCYLTWQDDCKLYLKAFDAVDSITSKHYVELRPVDTTHFRDGSLYHHYNNFCNNVEDFIAKVRETAEALGRTDVSFEDGIVLTIHMVRGVVGNKAHRDNVLNNANASGAKTYPSASTTGTILFKVCANNPKNTYKTYNK